MPRLNMHSHGVLIQPKKVKLNSLRLGWLCTDLIKSLSDGDDMMIETKPQTEHICLMPYAHCTYQETTIWRH